MERQLPPHQGTRHAQSLGATAVMAIPPIAVGVPDSELSAYYEALLAAIDIPVVVQDASGYVGRFPPPPGPSLGP